MTECADIRKNRGELASEQQRRASNPLKSVWVEASAGTGKTKVLSDRVLRLLLNNVNPAKILCLTYTKAAAVEMNDRIAKRLSEWAVASDETLHKELYNLLGSLPESAKEYALLEAKARQLFALLLDTPGGMKIQTIHSFCQEVLKRFPLEAQVSPYFSVMDDRMAAEALDDVKTHLLQKIEQSPDSEAAKAIVYLTQNISESRFPKVFKAIAENRNKLVRFLSAYHSMEEILAALAQKFGISPDDTEETLIASFLNKGRLADVQRIILVLQHGSKTDVDRALVIAKFWEGDASVSFKDYAACFVTQEEKTKLATKDARAFDSGVDSLIKEEAHRVLDMKNKLVSLRVFTSTKAVLLLSEELIRGYNAYKALHSKMDYEDLIVLTRHLLENQAVAQWVMYKLDGGIDSVLIDEAQDTSPDQWAIVKALTEEFFAGIGADDIIRTVFAVGDRKQSIYSFQGADPEEFENMRRYFHEVSDNFEEVKLDVSFRSTAAVLDTVNTVFGDETAKKGVVLPEQDITHVPFRVGDAGKVELWPLVEPLPDDNPDEWLPPIEKTSAASTSSRLAEDIAKKIKSMVDKGEILKSKNRPVRYGDFLVLVQRRNAFVEEFVRACKKIGVEVAGVDKIKLLEQMAIQDLIGIGKFLLLPTDDLTLAEILKSPLWGLDDMDLFELCYKREGAPLLTRLSKSEKFAAVYAELQQLLNKVDYVRPFELYSFILNKLSGRKKFVARMGKEVEDGIDEFMNLTVAFEQDHVPSLQSFIDWITQDEVEIKREQEQASQNLVRLMTVHGSKGLQAPIVILPDTVRVASEKKEAAMLWDELMYFPLKSADYDDICLKINQRQNQKALEEYRRLLYVALTRAEDRLCICGYKSKNAIKGDCWYDVCRRNFAENAKEEDDGCMSVETEQEFVEPDEKKKQKVDVAGNKSLEVPEWLFEPAPEEDLLAKPYTPSRPDEEDELSESALVSPIFKEDEHRFRRGRVIHKLLQFLPDVKQGDLRSVILDFLSANAADLPAKQHEIILHEVLHLLENPAFEKVFGVGSKAEVPLMGQVDGKIVSAQIDRLVVRDDEVLIIDFKTNRPAAKTIDDVPQIYKKQLAAYKQLVERIYPAKAVHCFILWTDTAFLMPLD